MKKLTQGLLVGLVALALWSLVMLAGCTQTELAKINAHVDTAQDAAVEAVTAANEAQSEKAAIIEAIRVANIASAPINPYSPYVELGLIALSAIWGVKLQERNREIKGIKK